MDIMGCLNLLTQYQNPSRTGGGWLYSLEGKGNLTNNTSIHFIIVFVYGGYGELSLLSSINNFNHTHSICDSIIMIML